MGPLHPHALIGSEQILIKHYAAGRQESFVCPLHTYSVIYTLKSIAKKKWWKLKPTKYNKLSALEKQYDYRIWA